MKNYKRLAQRKKASAERSAEEEDQEAMQQPRAAQEDTTGAAASGTPSQVSTSVMDEKRHLQRGRTHTRPTRTAHKTEVDDTEEEKVVEHGTILDEKKRFVRQRNKQPADDTEHVDEELGTMLAEKQRIAARGKHRLAASKKNEVLDIGEHPDSNKRVGTAVLTEKERFARRKADRTNLSPFPEGTPSSPVATRTEDAEVEDKDLEDSGIDSFVPQIEPGVVFVGIEREDTARILSDPPEDPVTARSRSDLLVHAHVVNENADNAVEDKVLATATPDPWWRRHQWWLAGGAVVIVGAIILAVVMTTVNFAVSETDAPSVAPTTYSEGIEDQTVQLIKPLLPADSAIRLEDASSPQYAALQWVAGQRLENEAAYSDSLVVQHYSLAVLFFGTGGRSSWNRTDGWLSTSSTCEWYGVECELEANELTGLNLTKNGLKGPALADIALLDTQLRVLDLSDNDLSGTIPDDFGRMTVLTYLSLHANNLAGSFPSSLGTMTNLVHLDLSENSLISTLPPELGSLTLLKDLRLDENEFTGEIPSQVGSLIKLRHMRLAENRLSYELPSELGNIGDLKTFDAKGNALLGPLPTEIGRMASLSRLQLSENFIFSKVPYELGRLGNLTSLDLSGNLLTGALPGVFERLGELTSLNVRGNFFEGTIPWRSLGENQQLVELDLSGNFFTGTLPLTEAFESLDALDVSSNRLEGLLSLGPHVRNLEVLDVSSNRFSDYIPGLWLSSLSVLNVAENKNIWFNIPQEIGSSSNLVSLNVSHMALNGTIPSLLWLLAGLESLDISGNVMTGPLIPSEIAALTNLRELDVLQRGFGRDSIIPSDIGLLTELRGLNLEEQSFSGSLPSQLGRLSMLSYFLAEGNYITGSIPSELGMLSSLVDFRLEDNRFSTGRLLSSLPSEFGRLSLLTNLRVIGSMGWIPSEVGSMRSLVSCQLTMGGKLPPELFDLTNLRRLGLFSDDTHSTNNMRATISSQIGLLTNLKSLELTGSILSGKLPTEIGLNTELIELWIYDTLLSGTIPSELGLNMNLKMLQLFENSLHGTIPSEVGLVTRLTGFSCYGNLLDGSIPSEIGLVAELYFLKAHGNFLSGTLPSEMGRLGELIDLTLADNTLNGTIPSEIGQTARLHDLNLGSNGLSGSIPSEIGLLSLLRGLFLQNNSLSGVFPMEISIREVDITNTEITGSIPNELCSGSRTFNVDCDKVVCDCCSNCPGSSPTGQPSKIDVPIKTPTTSAAPSTFSPVPSIFEEPAACSPFSPIALDGTRLSIPNEENGTVLVELPFEFPWQCGCGLPFKQVRVTNNGVLFLLYSFDSTHPFTAFPFPIDTYTPFEARIAVAQTHLDATTGGSVYTAQVDDAYMVVSWEGVPFIGDGPENGLNFQVVLYANGDVEMRWGEGTPKGLPSFPFRIAAGLDGILGTVFNFAGTPVTGSPFDGLSGLSDDWPLHQCRMFVPAEYSGYTQL